MICLSQLLAAHPLLPPSLIFLAKQSQSPLRRILPGMSSFAGNLALKKKDRQTDRQTDHCHGPTRMTLSNVLLTPYIIDNQSYTCSEWHSFGNLIEDARIQER